MPVVLLEAAASGLPAVVTDAGGSPEVVANGKTGFVVGKRDHWALSKALDRMMDMPEKQRLELGTAARLRALQEFDIRRVVSQWESLYLSCLSGRTSSSGGRVLHDRQPVASR
jgi:glycosyltransferase involved in cell wall biosynthesis